jgi:large subunit ribosomal protein L10
MLRAKKKDFVAELEGICKDSTAVIFTHYHGLTVSQVTELRRKLRENDANFKVVKNTLLKIAAQNAKVKLEDNMTSGPIAIAYSKDPVAAAKGVVEFAKKNDDLKLLGGIVDNAAMPIEDIKKLSKLPSLDELRGKIVGLLQAPATKLAFIAQAPAGQLARVINAFANKDN